MVGYSGGRVMAKDCLCLLKAIAKNYCQVHEQYSGLCGGSVVYYSTAKDGHLLTD